MCFNISNTTTVPPKKGQVLDCRVCWCSQSTPPPTLPPAVYSAVMLALGCLGQGDPEQYTKLRASNMPPSVMGWHQQTKGKILTHFLDQDRSKEEPMMFRDTSQRGGWGGAVK